MQTWLDALPLTPRAAATRDRLQPESILNIADAIESFASVSDRPLIEIAERVLCGTADLLDGEGGAVLLRLVNDVLWDNEPRRALN